MRYLIALAAVLAAVSGIYYAGYSAGKTVVEKENAEAKLQSLINAVNANQKTDKSYEKILSEIRRLASPADCPVADAVRLAIDSMPEPVDR